MAVIFSNKNDTSKNGWYYRDFVNGNVWVGGINRKVVVDLVRVAANNKLEWRKVTHNTNKTCDCRIYEVFLTQENDIDTSLENLQYFFIRADRAREGRNRVVGLQEELTEDSEKTKEPELGLLVHVRGSDLFRLQVYFAMQAFEGIRYNLLYVVDNLYPFTENSTDYRKCHPIDPEVYLDRNREHQEKKSKLQTNYLVLGRLMPLLRVVDYNREKRSGDVSISDLMDEEKKQFNLPNGVKLSDEEFDECFRFEGNIWDIKWWKSLQECCKVLLVRTANCIVGSTKHPLGPKDKARLRTQLHSFISSKRDGMTFLAELCWFFHLQDLMKMKRILDLENRILNETILEHSYLEAITYSDGILQILENSCQHSQMHSAYLSIRLHHVDRDCTDKQLIETMQYRERIMNRYEAMWGESWILEREAKYYMEIGVVDDASYGKKTRMGILESYRKNAVTVHNMQEGVLSNQLKQLFDDETPAEADVIVHHYGIPALKQIVTQNFGAFLVSSPYQGKTEVVCCDADGSVKQKDFIADGPDETTEYHILYPLGLMKSKPIPQKETKWQNLWELDCLKNPQEHNIQTTVISVPNDITELSFSQRFMTQDEKINVTSHAVKSFRKKLKELSDLQNRIILFDLREINCLQLELFAKFLFHIILDSKGSRRLYALYFNNYIQQQELTRLFVIFYRRAQYRFDPANTQLALCSTSCELEIPEVNMIFNVKDWNSLWESAYRYAYSNLESSKDIYSQIKYLTDEYSMSDEEDVGSNPELAMDSSLFPFDLYLKEEIISDEYGLPKKPEGVRIPESSDCWFLWRIYRLMERDLQQENMGIKISGVHVYLPSNIHINDFYEAEQLFRKISYVCRFAYLLALRLRQNGYRYDSKNTLVVCYEAYSSLLVQYLVHYLRASREDSSTTQIEYAVVYCEDKNSPRLLMPPSLADCTNKEALFKEWQFITLCPIGTTLLTVHTMHDCIKHETHIALTANNTQDLVIILVSEKKESGSKGYTGLQASFWSFVEGNVEQDKVRMKERFKHGEWDVHYFLSVESAGHDPKSCAKQAESGALVYADNTSTELNMIFPLKSQNINFDGIIKTKEQWKQIHEHDVCSLIPFDKRGMNNQRLELLKGCIYYGHIVRGSNHYAYYLDFSRYFEKIQQSGVYDAWLTELRSKENYSNAFNIIVTPLRTGTSPLLKDLVDRVFKHSIHILQLDLHNVRRTDIRAKYRHIALECAETIQKDPTTQINIYYVDDSLVTAETLQRGYNLVSMLLMDCFDKNMDKISLFKGVFVLVNRSSRDTVQTFVKKPDSDFHAFVHLANPHYNTRNNYCPACMRLEKYDLLTKRSATNLFVEEYQRLSVKHGKRTVEEYIKWQKEQLWESPSAFLCLRQWIFNNERNGSNPEAVLSTNNESLKNVKRTLEELRAAFCHYFCEEHKLTINGASDETQVLVNALCCDSNLQQAFLKELGKSTLSKQMLAVGKMKNDSLCEDFEFVWLNLVLADKAYRRLISTHNAYCGLWLEKEPTIPEEFDVVISKTQLQPDLDLMKSMIINQLLSDGTIKFSPILRWERIHSGLKVISRDVLARHHLVREAIFLILKDAAETLLGKGTNEPIMKMFRVSESCKRIPTLDERMDCGIDPLLRYQMFYSIMRRLADMQSNYPILTLKEGQVVDKLDELTKIFFSKKDSPQETYDVWFNCTIPSYQQMIFDYEKCIKLSTMAEDDENKSSLIQDEQLHRPANN